MLHSTSSMDICRPHLYPHPAAMAGMAQVVVDMRAGRHQVMVEGVPWYSAATAKVVLPQAMLRMVHPLRSWKGLGYMVLSPLAFSLPHAHSWGPTMLQKLLVLPAATCRGLKRSARLLLQPGHHHQPGMHCKLCMLPLAR